MSTSVQDFNAQIKEKFRANGGGSAVRGISPPDVENRAPAPSVCRTADGAA
jgi:hypothetical protein